MIIILFKRRIIIYFLIIFFLGLTIISLSRVLVSTFVVSNNQEIESVIKELFYKKNISILYQDKELLESLYDKRIKYSLWALEHERKKMEYLKQWANKQGVYFTKIETYIKIRYIKKIENKISINLIGSTEYRYKYVDENHENLMRIGTYHSIDIERKEDRWIIVREWYTDPFADSLNLDEVKSKNVTEFILKQNPRPPTTNIRRLQALEYMDKFCGAASSHENGFEYNNKYRNFNSQGGDCANFASQILYEGGKFKKTYSWNYDNNEATRAWVNAQGFKDYMLFSGRASKVAYGNYEEVYKAAYKLLPGDFIAYEKNGKVVHISVVSGSDSKGYTLVNSHNTDRYRVPWDLGWSNKGIKFWLIRVHF